MFDVVVIGVLRCFVQGGSCSGGCGSGTQLQNTQSVSSHEFAETVTDPAVGYATSNASPLGWYNQANGEIGDLCNGLQTTTVLGDGNSYSVQQLWSNAAGACVTTA